MRVKGIVVEDFTNYRKPALFIASAFCDWKCCFERGLRPEVCQNAPLVSQPTHNVSDFAILNAFRNSEISQAVVIGGLEPMDQFDEIMDLIQLFRSANIRCPFVIYTGYNECEIPDKLARLAQTTDIGDVIVKVGRYIPGCQDKYDTLLGVRLASDNQYAIDLATMIKKECGV